MHELYTKLNKLFPLGELTEQRDDLAFITIEQAQLRSLILHLRDKENFTHLVLLTAVDWLEDNIFQLTYLLSNRETARDIGLRVMLDRDDAVVIAHFFIHIHNKGIGVTTFLKHFEQGLRLTSMMVCGQTKSEPEFCIVLKQ